MTNSILHTSPEVSPRGEATALLLDADYLAYLCGAISQSKERVPDVAGQEYTCVDTNKDVWVWAWVDPWPLVEWRVDNEIDKIKDTFDSDNLSVYLTPETGNFRVEVAVTKPYKGGRSGTRPYWWRKIREYLQDSYAAEMAVGHEADDAVCIAQYGNIQAGVPSVIIGPDKDLDCMYGYHYIPTGKQKGLKWNTWQDAMTHFYMQMIVGDTVDNIPGLPGKGIKFFEKLQRQVEGDPDPYALEELVVDAYLERDPSGDLLYEQGNLLHMKRSPGDMWFIPYPWDQGYQIQEQIYYKEAE